MQNINSLLMKKIGCDKELEANISLQAACVLRGKVNDYKELRVKAHALLDAVMDAQYMTYVEMKKNNG